MLMYKKNDNCERVIPFATSRGKMEGCEICTLSTSIDGHRSHVYLPADKTYYKKKVNCNSLISH